MIVGDPAGFAIESGITLPLAAPSQCALGFFIIHVAGTGFGVRSPEASLLACSLDAVKRRIGRRGRHCAAFSAEPSALRIVDAVQAAIYDEGRQAETFFGMTGERLCEDLASSGIVWAPDGDAAFDDGGHVLQFDRGDEVRLIGFKNVGRREQVLGTVAEAWIGGDVFYARLEEWQTRFEAELAAAMKLAAAWPHHQPGAGDPAA